MTKRFVSPRIISREDLAGLRGAEAVLAQAETLRQQVMADADALKQKVLADARRKALRDSTQTAARVIVEAESAAEQRLTALEPQVAKLVSATVAQIIGDMDRTEAVERATRQALLRLRDHRRARILAAPDVAEAVKGAVARLDGQGAEVIEVQVDSRLEKGRTVLSSDRGHVEIGLSDQVSSATEVWRSAAGDTKAAS